MEARGLLHEAPLSVLVPPVVFAETPRAAFSFLCLILLLTLLVR